MAHSSLIDYPLAFVNAFLVILPSYRKMSDTEGNLGVVDDHVNVHRFFKVVDARNWDRITHFFKLRDIEKTTAEHSEMYLQDLHIISEHKGVSDSIQRRAKRLLKYFAVDEFRNEFGTLLLNAAKEQAKQSTQNFHLGIIEAGGTLVNKGKAYNLRPSTKSSSRLSSKRAREEEQSALSTQVTADNQSKKSRVQASTLQETEFPSQSSQDDSDFIGSNPSSARSSLNSIEIGFVNHLVGIGTTSSRLRTSDHLIIEDTNVSEILMDARRSVVRNQSEIKTVSDLLVLNFIFNAEFMEQHLPPKVAKAIHRISLPTPSPMEVKVLADCSMFVACHSFIESKQYFREKVPYETMIGEVLRSYTTRSSLWGDSTSSLPRNEDSYIMDEVRHIIIGVFGDLEARDHWMRDPLPTPQGFDEVYLPDYFAEKDGFPFIVVEVKKPEIESDDILEGDRRKLPSMMKLALNRMLEAGVESPVVIGLLVSAGKCQIFLMSLKYEALYILEEVGEFELPTSHLQLGLLFAALCPLLLVQLQQQLSESGPTSRARVRVDQHKRLKGKKLTSEERQAIIHLLS
ncbi:hypothetical protein BGX27_008458, partial [Mortierella sp. AM989]